jgi:hypothetical protein
LRVFVFVFVFVFVLVFVLVFVFVFVLVFVFACAVSAFRRTGFAFVRRAVVRGDPRPAPFVGPA